MDHLSVYVAHSSDKNKRIQTVEAHLQGGAAKAEKLARKLELPQAGSLIGLLHDFGKYSQAFQEYFKNATGLINSGFDVGAMKGKINHSTAGVQWIHQQLSRRGTQEVKIMIGTSGIGRYVRNHNPHVGMISWETQDIRYARSQSNKNDLNLRSFLFDLSEWLK